MYIAVPGFKFVPKQDAIAVEIPSPKHGCSYTLFIPDQRRALEASPV